MELYDNYSDKAKIILEQAYVEVANMNMNYVGSEHLLLSLLKVKSEIIDAIKRYNRLTYKDVKKECLRFVGIGLVKREIQGYSRRASEILKQANFEANSLKSLNVEPEHILLALLDLNESTAVKILEKIGFSAFDLKTDIIRELDMKDKAKAKAKKEAVEGSFVKRFGVNMTQQAIKQKYDDVIGREDEIQRVIQILGRRTKNNPCLVGEPGVGKTAIAEGVANIMASHDAPDYLLGKSLIAISLGAMLAGSKFRGEFEDRLTQLIKEVQTKQNIILFIDEIHTLVGAGATQGAMDAANLLKPFLSRDDVQLIGATTLSEYRKYIEKDLALERRLQPVRINEPRIESCIAMLRGIKSSYEDYHNIQVTEEAIVAAVKLSDQYITDRFLPDKAIDLMDEAASRIRLAREEILTDVHIKEVVALWTGMEVKELTLSENEALLALSDKLKQDIVGQDLAIQNITNAVIRSRVGLSDHQKPLGSFIFLGQTGVGKTALAKALAEALFGHQQNLIRIDMTEYMEKHSVSKLIGSPPGYIAYEEGGHLTEQIRNKPFSVVLFDEIEKAHPDVLNVLLPVLDEGLLTDGKGKTINFKQSIIIFTSNIGTDQVKKQSIGFGASDINSEDYLAFEERLNEALEASLTKEFLNRIDEIVIFRSLEETHVLEIISKLLKSLTERVQDLGYDIRFTDGVKKLIYEVGYSEDYGVRSLKRSITRLIENPLASYLMTYQGEKRQLIVKLNGKKDIEIQSKMLERAKNG